MIEIPKNALAEALVHLSDGARLSDVCRHLLSAVPGQRSEKKKHETVAIFSEKTKTRNCRHLLSAVPGQRSEKQEAKLFFLLSHPFAHTGQRSKTQEAVLVAKISAAISRNLGVSKNKPIEIKITIFLLTPKTQMQLRFLLMILRVSGLRL